LHLISWQYNIHPGREQLNTGIFFDLFSTTI
jgi:hypothetical protein